MFTPQFFENSIPREIVFLIESEKSRTLYIIGGTKRKNKKKTIKEVLPSHRMNTIKGTNSCVHIVI